MIKCVLDEDGCIDLLAVMRIMNQVDQEQVWAIAYELAALMQRLWPAGNCAPIESLAQIYIRRDGSIHEKSLLTLPGPRPNAKSNPQDPSEQQHQQHQIPQAQTIQQANEASSRERSNFSDSSTAPVAGADPKQQQLPPSPPITPELTRRRPALSESELVSSLGIALFWTLDYGIPDDEERKLSMTMEYLIFKSQSELALGEILEICIKRLDIATKTNADLHYRGVCKSLIDDTIELSIFLDKIYTATMALGGKGGAPAAEATPVAGACLVDNCCLVAAAAKCHHKDKDSCDNLLSHHYRQLAAQVSRHDDLGELGLPLASLRALKIDDWARLWMQVIKEMRQRNKFKHLNIATAGQELGCSNL